MLQALLTEVHPAWHRTAVPGLDDALLARARTSALGRRMLAAWLAEGPGQALLAPGLQDASGLIARWSRPRLDALHRDLGTLAFAPAIRAEIRREPVRRLKAELGTGYLLAIDRSVWDAQVEPALQSRLACELAGALEDGQSSTLSALLARQGEAELQAWAGQREPALAEWARLLGAPSDAPAPHLPEKPVLIVHTHHQSRAIAA
ncbi:hypothetical protein [Luteimonas deserti]|uniref:Uncharacterized protein n=1 Tax=Luteimonas deserti TaxID=2752306 RepID=A0A7Z0QQX8_9GAMM|nr:hypothetical protein [Luteimonas deserti]NYZ62100.1 hypothetical protein [Luteimonas deserti]